MKLEDESEITTPLTDNSDWEESPGGRGGMKFRDDAEGDTEGSFTLDGTDAGDHDGVLDEVDGYDEEDDEVFLAPEFDLNDVIG